MSPEMQRVAIAEVCGLNTSAFGGRFVPDYLNCLNAMHEAEMILDKETQQKYLTILQGGEPRYKLAFSVVCATAAQRAEAFLCAIGKWQEDK